MDIDAREIVGVVIDIAPMAVEIGHIRHGRLGETQTQPQRRRQARRDDLPRRDGLSELHGDLRIEVPRQAPSRPGRNGAAYSLILGRIATAGRGGRAPLSSAPGLKQRSDKP